MRWAWRPQVVRGKAWHLFPKHDSHPTPHVLSSIQQENKKLVDKDMFACRVSRQVNGYEPEGHFCTRFFLREIWKHLEQGLACIVGPRRRKRDGNDVVKGRAGWMKSFERSEGNVQDDHADVSSSEEDLFNVIQLHTYWPGNSLSLYHPNKIRIFWSCIIYTVYWIYRQWTFLQNLTLWLD